MNCEEPCIRFATLNDAEEILGIYAPYVLSTAITFEYDVPDLREFKGRMEHTLKKYPYLVAAMGEEILGYAYTGAFVGRSAYDWSAETSIYLKENKRKMGLGKKLYYALETISKAQNILNLNACIAYPPVDDEYLTKNSVEFHTHLGYQMVGEFHKCGYKFGKWYNMVWMEKMIGEHIEHPHTFIPICDLDDNALATLKLF